MTQQMQAIAATSNGNMTFQQQSYTQQPVAGRITAPVVITNCILTLQGTASPQRFYVMTGHLDSRCTDVTDFTSDAPGADDDGSGVAIVLELARLFATQQFPGTIVLATVSGEEQGMFGSTFMAQQMAAAGNDVQGMFSNDIVGTGDAHDGWTSAIPAGNVTTVTLNISKDNVQFGVRAVDQNGNRSPVAFPLAVA